MIARLFRGSISLTAIYLAACSSGWAGTPFRVSDPGVRAAATDAGTAVSGVDAPSFAKARHAFREVHSIAGDLESGAGLGPGFNGTSCGACHAFPSLGGSSPKRNPQLEMAIAHGARNNIPDFMQADGPVLAVRLKRGAGSTAAGDVLPLFTVNGRSDAFNCAVKTPDFRDNGNLSFRIPTPLFGSGLIENIPDSVILANRRMYATAKLRLEIGGEPNAGEDGALGRFGWKAQHRSLMEFAGEAYRTEMGVPNEIFGYRRESLTPVCYTLYEAAYDDPNYTPTYEINSEPPVLLFTRFMRFLKPPAPVKEFPGATVHSIRNGSRLFESVGCSLCHTPSLRTGKSDLPALNDREAPLYSDLLLHHMGSRLADGIVQGRAVSGQFRTAPLWGVGQRIFFLHDGRTTDLLVAIQDHASDGGGLPSEANAVIGRFNGLSPAEQQDIVNFVRSL
jgi:CxxC motif-containing protein (DUF1111 family)